MTKARRYALAMSSNRRSLVLFCLCAVLAACNRSGSAAPSPHPSPLPGWPRLDEAVKLLPPGLASAILADREAFLRDLSSIPEGERDLLMRVDKERALSPSYAPADLLSLNGTGLSLSREDLSLRKAAVDGLLEMDRAARRDGVVLLVSSSYRSYEYQRGVWERSVAAYGEEQTAREVALPGHSQHQLGTVVDFGSIDDSFARTKASHWLISNAIKYGFSLSYPEGYEPMTGYRHESWHYRFIGKAAASLQERWFGGIQHWLIVFAEAWHRP